LSRGFAVFVFWLIGFGIGFAGYLSLPELQSGLLHQCQNL